MKKCIQCDKPLPPGYAGNTCSLCAIGLVPTKSAESLHAEVQAPVRINGRKLSGLNCPNCNADLSMADTIHRSCSICGARISPERLSALKFVRDHPQLNTRVVETKLGDARWPDDAPMR